MNTVANEKTVNNVLPKAGFGGVLIIADAPIKCYVVDYGDGKPPLRLLTGRTLTNAFGLTGRGQGMSRFLAAKWVEPHITPDTKQAILQPVEFIITSGIVPSKGYKAEVLPQLCYAIIDGYDVLRREDKPISSYTERTYAAAKILGRSFSTVGIHALVDEATGYQEVRDRRALQEILDKWLVDEWRRHWARTFEPEFYKEMFRLREWKWNQVSSKRPGFVGHLTNDVVYSRLAPNVLNELKERVPKNETGKPTKRLHMGLTEDHGVPALKQHLTVVTALMRASTSWPGFIRLLDRSLPKCGSYAKTLSLPGLEDDNAE